MQPNWLSALLASPEIGRLAGQSDEGTTRGDSEVGPVLALCAVQYREYIVGPAALEPSRTRDIRRSIFSYRCVCVRVRECGMPTTNGVPRYGPSEVLPDVLR